MIKDTKEEEWSERMSVEDSESEPDLADLVIIDQKVYEQKDLQIVAI